MIIEKTRLDGVMLIKPVVFEDHRGSYTMTYNERDYGKALEPHDITAPRFVEDDISISGRNVLRGIHGDKRTSKLISCLEGKFYLVVINNVEGHKQYRQWTAFTLSETNRYQVLVPAGFGNGHLVMSERAIFSYKQSAYYDPDSQFTLVWNDPALNIWWPTSDPILSRRDQVGHFVT
jgi:dTDP-4-dehydrorhamnose 3,5-epimerase